MFLKGRKIICIKMFFDVLFRTLKSSNHSNIPLWEDDYNNDDISITWNSTQQLKIHSVTKKGG